MKKLDLYYIDMKYIRNLAKVDNNVMSVSPQIGKENRPFVGVIVLLNNKKYCIPLTSVKEKFRHSKSHIDLIKILDMKKKNAQGAPNLIGILNVNNMIPVDDRVLSMVDLKIHFNDTPVLRKHKELMQKQLAWCRDNYDVILNRANKVYCIILSSPEKNRNLVRRCCNFKKLEAVLDKYLAAHSQERQNSTETHPQKRSAEAEHKQASPRSAFPLSRDKIKRSADIIRSKEQEKSKDKPQEKKHNKNREI